MSEEDTSGGVSSEKILAEITSPQAWERLTTSKLFSSSYLWGIGVGSLVMAHKLRVHPGRVRKALNWGFSAFVGVTAFKLHYDSYIMMKNKAIMHEINDKYM